MSENLSSERLVEVVAELEARITQLEGALAFYRDEWSQNADGDVGGESHLTRTWYEPTSALWDDAGRKAGDVLAARTHARHTEEEG